MELFLSTKVLKITCEYVQIAFYVHYKEVRGSVLSLAPVLWEKCMLESDQHTHTVLCDWELSCEELSTGRDVVNLPETYYLFVFAKRSGGKFSQETY